VAALRLDVQRIRSSPYLPKDLAVIGCIYDVKTGLIDVAAPPE
jgi:carbonic anhydrase